MVIPAVDSEKTLVSVNGNLKQPLTSSFVVESPTSRPSSKRRRLLPGLRSTRLQVPADDHTDFYTEPLHLPLNELFSVEDVIESYPCLVDQRERILRKVVEYGKSSETNEDEVRYVYIHQGELGHAIPSNCDVLVSDRATTCHILAFRSSGSSNEPLSTLTHIDGTGYGKCLKAAVQFHRQHHGEHNKFQLDIHIVGGFNDENETSAGLTKWLFTYLADLADRYHSTMTFCLRTACVSALNDRNGTPRGRGLAIHCATGRVTLAQAHCLGPLPPLRAARIWSNARRTLHTVYSIDGRLRVPKFAWKPVPDYLLKLSDAQLLQQCSTSPAAEEEDFCTTVRQTFLFLKAMTPEQVFGQRSLLEWEQQQHKNNMWVPVG